MIFSETHDEKILRLLKKDSEKRKSLREYQRQYRAKQKEETGKAQKQYYDIDDMKMRSKENYKKKTVLNDIKFLFE